MLKDNTPWMIDVATGIALFTRCVFPEGTPRHTECGRQNNRGAHYRAAWVKAYGPIPQGKCIDHLCNDNRCQTLEHLSVCTQAENLERGRLRGTRFNGEEVSRYPDVVAFEAFRMRFCLGLTQGDIHRELGVKGPIQSHWYTGKRKPHVLKQWVEQGMPYTTPRTLNRCV